MPRATHHTLGARALSIPVVIPVGQMSQQHANIRSMTPTPRPHPTLATAAGAHSAAVGQAERFPVLDEVPELGHVLDLARRIDRLVAQLVTGLMELRASDLAEHTTGVPLEQWLAIVARRTGADRRMLTTTCEVLERLPTLRRAFLEHATISWAQTRTVVLQVCRLPHHLDATIDATLGPIIHGAAGADPDAIGSAVSWALASLDPTPPRTAGPAPEQFLAMQPRLDGSGGRIWGEFNALGFATLDTALNTDTRPPAGPTRDTFGSTPDPIARKRLATQTGAARAQRLLDLVDHHCADRHDHDADHDADGVPGKGGRRAGRRPQLLIRISLDTLLDRDHTPPQLLTTLTGGRMWADATTIRTLVAARGADLRTIVLDDTGTILGVGRRTRIPPDWLTDATLALHDTCTAPGCRTAARICDLDHATPWHPTPDAPTRGPTDLTNLAPLCATDNRRKEPAGWRATQHPDHTRTWYHPRTGLTTRTLPATWQPPPPNVAPPPPPPGPPPPEPPRSGTPPSRRPPPTAEPHPDIPF
jgi:hypothetical protein